MKVLLLASSSFAATGLSEELSAAGHEVWTFNRRLPIKSTSRDLAGTYQQLRDIAKSAMNNCDVVINYAIAKNDSIEQNILLANLILDAANQLGVRRFIHISSISVLPSIKGSIDEDAKAVEARWKGIYSRVKASVEEHIIKTWRHNALDIVRPGFILASGLVDSMVGTGLKLPTGHVLGLGNRKSIIMLIHRDTVNLALTKIASAPISERSVQKTYMLVAPNAPTRQEYLDFQCRELGRGWHALHLPSWLWRLGLAIGSPLLSILKRKPFRLVRLFEHNLSVRTYDCTRTSTELGLDMNFDWKDCLMNLVHLRPSPVWPIAPSKLWPKSRHLCYVGIGRIVFQKHLPGLARQQFSDEISWIDPAIKEPPQHPKLAILAKPGYASNTSHAVITTPWTVRCDVLNELPDTTEAILFEKPFAISSQNLSQILVKLQSKNVAVLHNYRFKPNILNYRNFLRSHPPGALRSVSLHFETPSPANEQSNWMKQERLHRILLCDYAIHYLDLAWIFCTGTMKVHRCVTSFNDRDELENVSANLSFDGVPCDVLIRSGCHQRQCIITHHFQNFSAELRFFPDVFVPIIGGKGLVDDARLLLSGFKSTCGKIMEKLGLSSQDHSHDKVIMAFLGEGESAIMDELSITALKCFYERLTTLADLVYGETT